MKNGLRFTLVESRDTTDTTGRRIVHSTTGRQARTAFTLIELLIVIVILMILMAMLLPALSKVRRRATNLKCLNNIKQINMAVHMFLKDNDGRFPHVEGQGDGSFDSNQGRFWVGKAGTQWGHYMGSQYRPLNPYLGCVGIVDEVPMAKCATGLLGNYDDKGTDYFAPARGDIDNDLDGDWIPLKVSMIKNPSTMLLIFQGHLFSYADGGAPQWWDQVHYPNKPIYPVSFVDGHASFERFNIGEGIDYPSDTGNFRNF